MPLLIPNVVIADAASYTNNQFMQAIFTYTIPGITHPFKNKVHIVYRKLTVLPIQLLCTSLSSATVHSST